MKNSIFKIDCFYFLCNYMNLLKNSDNSRDQFKKLTSIYFEKPKEELKKTLLEEYKFENLCPIIFVKTREQF